MNRNINTLKFGSVLLLTALLSQGGCTKENFDTGFEGTLKVEYIDCMPPVDTTNLEYEDYKGTVWFIRKSLADNGSFSTQELLDNSISMEIKRGKISAGLPADTFYLWFEDLYPRTEEHTLVISEGQILRRDITTYICTVY